LVEQVLHFECCGCGSGGTARGRLVGTPGVGFRWVPTNDEMVAVRRNDMLKQFVIFMVLLCVSPCAWADAASDCNKETGDVGIKGCTEVIRQNPRNAAAYYNRGLDYSLKFTIDGDAAAYDRAIADFTKAIEINPRDANYYNDRGGLEKDGDRAIADYTKAVEVNPKFAVGYYNRAGCYEKKGDRDRAIADYRRALEIDPTGFAHARAKLEKLGVKP
jgi:tetratricopeptide (TPR) repeat protein